MSEDCLSCIRIEGKQTPNKVTKKLLTGFPVCDVCFEKYQPDLLIQDAKKDKTCPQCEKKFGVGFSGFCSEACFNARMDFFTKSTGNKTRDLLILADKLHKEKNEVEFQKVAKELAKMEHSLFIDESSINAREFALESLLAEYAFLEKNPDFEGSYEETQEYDAIFRKYFPSIDQNSEETES